MFSLLNWKTCASFRGQASYYGETPLGFACCTNQWDVAKILLKYGADMNMVKQNISIIEL